MRALTAIAMALSVCGVAQAQEVVHWSAPAAAVNGQNRYFPIGTPIHLVTRTELSTRNDRTGDRFYLETAEPIVYHGQIVVPAGSLAVGEIARVERNGALGKRGEMGVRLLYVQTPSGPIRLSGHAERQGRGQQALAIGGATLVAWPMIFIHGTSARIPENTGITAYLAEELTFPLTGEPFRTASETDGSGNGSSIRSLPARFDPSAFSGVRAIAP